MVGKKGKDKYSIDSSLATIESFLMVIEDFLDKESTSFRKYCERQDLSFFKEGKFEIHQKNLDYYFPNQLRKSLFVNVFSLIEYRLRIACEYIQKRDNLPPFEKSEANKKSTSLIERYRRYLVKIAQVSVAGSEEWKEICDYNKLRNCFVHNQGLLTIGKNGKHLRMCFLNNQGGE